MRITSTNSAQPVRIQWKGRTQITGIYKKPTSEGIFLTSEGVRGDTIGNPKVHGDAQKAAYLFSLDQYAYWQNQYPSLDWGYGMFGENLTVEKMDETTLIMGSTYQLGEAVVRITTPREPCFKLGIRFGDQGIIQKFVTRGYPGAYVSVANPGWIRPGDDLELLETPDTSLSIADFYRMWYASSKDPELLEKALSLPWLAEGKRKQLLQWVP
ncbi:MAG: MOSC domain-containing protein [Robiginitalea sp.]